MLLATYYVPSHAGLIGAGLFHPHVGEMLHLICAVGN